MLEQRVAQWLYGKLVTAVAATSAATHVYQGVVPQSGAYPCVVFGFSGSTPIYQVNNPMRRSHEVLVVTLKIIGTGSSPAAYDTIQQACFTAIQGATLIANDIRVLATRYQRQVQYPPEFEGGIQYNYLVSQYDIWASPVSGA